MQHAAMKDDEAALKYFSWAANLAWQNTSTSFVDAEIDSQIYSMGKQASFLPRRRPRGEKIRIAYICSGFHDTGGICQVVENFLRYQDTNKFESYVYSTEAKFDSDQNGTRRNHIFSRLAKRSFKPIFSSTYKSKSEQVKNQIIKDKIDVGFFFLLPNDVIAHYILPQLGLPLSVFFHASSHVFCLGGTLYDIHIDFNNIWYERCLRDANHPKTILMNQPGRVSLSHLDANKLQFASKKQLDFNPDSLLTVTCGGAHKIFWNDTCEYSDIITNILKKYDHVCHLLIGPGMQKVRSLVLANAPELSNRIKALDYVLNPIIKIYNDADIFFDTYPIGGALSSFDAMAAGLPVIAAPSLKYLLKDDTTIAYNSGEYFQIACRLIEDKPFRIKIGKQNRLAYKQNYDPAFLIKQYEDFFLKQLHISNSTCAKGHSRDFGEKHFTITARSRNRHLLVKLINEIIAEHDQNIQKKLYFLFVLWEFTHNKVAILKSIGFTILKNLKQVFA